MTDTSTPRIRKAATADALLLAELGTRTFSDAFAADNTPEDMAAYLEASFSPHQIASELADPVSTFLIAEIDGIAVGYAMLHDGESPKEVGDENNIELVRFYVSGEWHGRGVAARLMQACLDEARRKLYRTLWLGVWEHNGRARAFYRKWKFQDVGEHIFRLGRDLQNDVLMSRTL
ncbi:MAG: GNAT family N-acetyltransferase [Pyrinomonadaceae bacterium]